MEGKSSASKTVSGLLFGQIFSSHIYCCYDLYHCRDFKRVLYKLQDSVLILQRKIYT